MFAGVFDELFGVPTHPLAVHAPVVLIPILAVVAAVALVRTSWRERLALPLAVVAVVMVALLFAAKESGEAAAEANNVFGNIDRHQDLGNQTFILGVVWLVLAIAAAVSHVLSGRTPSSLSAAAAGRSSTQVTTVLNVLAVASLIVTTIWLIRTGHAGAESRWKL